MNDWFGKGCKYLSATWEDNEITGGPDYKEYKPELVYCNHIKNEDRCEGNCNPKQCPLGYLLDSFTQEFRLEDPLQGTQFSLFKEGIHKALIRSRGQCPCVIDPNLQGIDTLCPCKEYRLHLNCKCNLYVMS